MEGQSFDTFAYTANSRYNMGTIKTQGGPHMTITYTQVGDYLLPNLIPPESPKVGRWGMLRHSYLRNHREGLYTGMLMNGTLNAHLEEVDRRADEMEQRIISQLAQQEGITEQLKAENQLEWVRRMNSIRKRAEEMILHELIYI